MKLSKLFYFFATLVFIILVGLGGLSFVFHLRIKDLQLQIDLKKQEIKRKERELAFLRKQGFYPRLTTREGVDISNIALGGWIPEWAYEEGMESFIFKIQSFTNVSPVFYKLNKDGGIDYLIKNRQELRTEINRELDYLKLDKKVEIIPTLQSFDKDYVNVLLNDNVKSESFIREIISDLKENGLDGLDLNIEVIERKNKNLFFTFLRNLSLELKKNNLKLTIPVLPKWGSEDKVYSYLPETREVMDFVELSKIVDEIRVMAYDYTAQGANSSGPIAPLDWVKEVLEYTLARVPKEKVSLGIHLYGYSWNDKGGSTGPITYANVMRWQERGVVNDILYSEQYKEGLVKYKLDNENRTAYFATPESVRERIKLAESLGITKVSFWRLGDDPL